VLTPGQQLRTVREQLGLTMRDVEAASARLAVRHNNADFVIALSRLSDIETKGVVPNIYRLYSLAAVYRRDMHEILAWFGIDTSQLASEVSGAGCKSHLAQACTMEVRNTAATVPQVRSTENDRSRRDDRRVGGGAAGRP